MSKDGVVKTFPVVGYQVEPVPALEILLVQLAFISSPMQDIENADPGRAYVFTKQSALELAVAITKIATSMDGKSSLPKEFKH